MLCIWMAAFRAKHNAPDRTGIEFAGSAPARGNLEALSTFRQRKVMTITCPQP